MGFFLINISLTIVFLLAVPCGVQNSLTVEQEYDISHYIMMRIDLTSACDTMSGDFNIAVWSQEIMNNEARFQGASLDDVIARITQLLDISTPLSEKERKLVKFVIFEKYLYTCVARSWSTKPWIKRYFRDEFSISLKSLLTVEQYRNKGPKLMCWLAYEVKEISGAIGDNFPTIEKSVIDEIFRHVRTEFEKPSLVSVPSDFMIEEVDKLFESLKTKENIKRCLRERTDLITAVFKCRILEKANEIKLNSPKKLTTVEKDFIQNFICQKYPLKKQCDYAINEVRKREMAITIIRNDECTIPIYNINLVENYITKNFNFLPKLTFNDKEVVKYAIIKSLLYKSGCTKKVPFNTPDELYAIRKEFSNTLKNQMVRRVYRLKWPKIACYFNEAFQKQIKVLGNNDLTIPQILTPEISETVRFAFPMYSGDSYERGLFRRVFRMFDYIKILTHTKEFLKTETHFRRALLKCYLELNAEQFAATHPPQSLSDAEKTAIDNFMFEEYPLKTECDYANDNQNQNDLLLAILKRPDSDMSLYSHMISVVSHLKMTFTSFFALSVENRFSITYSLVYVLMRSSACRTKISTDTPEDVNKIRVLYVAFIRSQLDENDCFRLMDRMACYFGDELQRLISVIGDVDHFLSDELIHEVYDVVRIIFAKPSKGDDKHVPYEDLYKMFQIVIAKPNVARYLISRRPLMTSLLICQINAQIERIYSNPPSKELSDSQIAFVEQHVHSVILQDYSIVCDHATNEQKRSILAVAIIRSLGSDMILYHDQRLVEAHMTKMFNSITTLTGDEQDHLFYSIIHSVMVPSECTRMAPSESPEDLKKIFTAVQENLKARVTAEQYDTKKYSFICLCRGELQRLKYLFYEAGIPAIPEKVIGDIDATMPYDLYFSLLAEKMSVVTYPVARRLTRYVMERTETDDFIYRSEKFMSGRNYVVLICKIFVKAESVAAKLVKKDTHNLIPSDSKTPHFYACMTIFTLLITFLTLCVGWIHGPLWYKAILSRLKTA